MKVLQRLGLREPQVVRVPPTVGNNYVGRIGRVDGDEGG